jgi:hypothetical protein
MKKATTFWLTVRNSSGFFSDLRVILYFATDAMAWGSLQGKQRLVGEGGGVSTSYT